MNAFYTSKAFPVNKRAVGRLMLWPWVGLGLGLGLGALSAESATSTSQRRHGGFDGGSWTMSFFTSTCECQNPTLFGEYVTMIDSPETACGVS